MSRDRDDNDRPVAPDDEPVASEQPEAGDATPPHDAVGAYVLDALPEAERVSFEAHLASCADCQREVAELRPVVALLPRVLELDPPPMLAGGENGDAALAEPSDGLRNRILAAVREETAAAEPDVETDADAELDAVAPDDVEPVEEPEDETEPVRVAPTPLPTRPPGRIRPGAPAEVAPTSIWQSIMRRDRSWLAAAALAVVAVGAIIWALALQGQVNDKDDEIAIQQQEIATQEAELAELRDAGNASVAQLAPTQDGPDEATGSLFIPLSEEEGVLLVEGMDQLLPERAYQLWYLAENNPNPQPGPTFMVDDEGRGTAIVSSDTPTFNGVAITEEPEEGSEAPTTAILMTGELGAARG